MDARSFIKRLLIFSITWLTFAAESKATPDSLLRVGEWRGVLTLNDSTELPFTMSVLAGEYKTQPVYGIIIVNDIEKIQAEDVRVTRDSVTWTMPVFNTKFRCKRNGMTSFSGEWSNTAASKPYTLKFRADYGQPRFMGFHKYDCKPTYFFGGKWECTFSPGRPDSSKAVGIFTLMENDLYTGTFLTETGDFRYLAGAYTSCDEIALSCFDGQHAYLFKAKLGMDNIIRGKFWSGKFGYENWTAKRNDKFELRDPNKLTWITDSTNVNFTFNDLSGKPVSLSDPQFQGKVVIVQIMGTWCPNCMDETAWLADVYNRYHPQGLEIIALAYERPGDTATQNNAIRRLQERYHANYTFLNTGKSGAAGASASLPFLNGVMGFPTTIYIDRSGNVRRVYTGFNGPATGQYYERDTQESLKFIQMLLGEKPGIGKR